MHTLEPSLARVNSSGTVFWSRPGSLDVMCKFSGLVAFPFDTLTCRLEVGGWTLSGGQQGIQLEGGGYAFEAQEATSGSSYQELQISNVTAELKTYSYSCCPSEPYPIAMYSISLDRAYTFYATSVLIPGVLITLLSFIVFWADTNSADALGYGIGVIIVNLVANSILMGILPVCGELLWIDLFALLNTAFCCISLFQSAFNIMVEQLEDDHLLPVWIVVPALRVWSWFMVRWRKQRSKYQARVDPQDSPSTAAQAQVKLTATSQLASDTLVKESVAGFLFRQQPGAMNSDATAAIAASARAQLDASAEERARKLIFFEQLFYRIDADCSQFVDVDEFDLLLSYSALDLDPLARKALFGQYDFFKDGRLSRVEFVAMCMDVLWHVPQDLLQMAISNLDVARKSRKQLNGMYWKTVAGRMDSWARVIIPASYVLALVVLFNVELTDGYTTDNAPSFSGFGPAQLSSGGAAWISTYSVLAVVVGALWLRAKTVAAKDKKTLEDEHRVASREKLESFASEHVERTRASTRVNEPEPSPTAYRAPNALQPLPGRVRVEPVQPGADDDE